MSTFNIGNRPFPAIIHVKRGNELRRYAPQRTCRDIDYDTESITCSECGEITRDALFWVDVDGGKTVKGHRPRFCSNCGAKVVDNGA